MSFYEFAAESDTESDAESGMQPTGGIVNFGGQIVPPRGQFLRVNETMQTHLALNTRADQAGDVFIVGEPMQVDTFVLNRTGSVNHAIVLQILINENAIVLPEFTEPGVMKLMNPLLLNRGDSLQVSVANFSGPIAACLFSVYLMPR